MFFLPSQGLRRREKRAKTNLARRAFFRRQPTKKHTPQHAAAAAATAVAAPIYKFVDTFTFATIPGVCEPGGRPTRTVV